MLKKSKFILPVLAGMLAFQACDKLKGDSFKKTSGGLEYQLYSKSKDGKYESITAPAATDTAKLNKEGQVARFHLKIVGELAKGGKDTVLIDTYERGIADYSPIPKPTFKGGVEDALAFMAPGDSGVFRIPGDSLFKKNPGQPAPAWFKKGGNLTYYLKLEKLMNQQEAMMDQQTSMMAFMDKQNKKDDAVIQKYIKEKGMQPQKTNSGLYYVITKPGTGEKAAAGKMVSVHYTGTTLDGKEFDSSFKNPQMGGKPYEFPLGQGQVIRGWDEGIALLNKGSKATLLVPSTMAYGPQASPKIPANSVLRFDVELVDVKEGQPMPQFPMQPQQ